MKWYWPLLILIFAAFIYATTMMYRGPSITVGDRHTFALTTLDGESLTEVNPTGGPTVVEFWASWCGPCIDSMPHLQQLQAKHRADGVRFIGVSLDDNTADQQQAITEYKLDWINVNDYKQPQSLASAWGVYGIPHTFLFSPTGELLWDGYPTDLDGPLAQAISKYQAQRK